MVNSYDDTLSLYETFKSLAYRARQQPHADSNKSESPQGDMQPSETHRYVGEMFEILKWGGKERAHADTVDGPSDREETPKPKVSLSYLEEMEAVLVSGARPEILQAPNPRFLSINDLPQPAVNPAPQGSLHDRYELPPV